VPVIVQVKNICLPSDDTAPEPGDRTSSIAWMRRETAGSRRGAAYLASTSGDTLAAPCPE
jgi:hypothetical protein